jgi:hypothetical protein
MSCFPRQSNFRPTYKRQGKTVSGTSPVPPPGAKRNGRLPSSARFNN